MAFTSKQAKFRMAHIGGSDANTIMSGDKERILHLWKLKRGEEQDEDLSGNLAVQMGVFTEPFNVQWFEKQTGRKVTNAGEQHEHKSIKFMGCTLDGMTDDGKTVFEAKHVGAFQKPDEIQDRYMPQLYHNMMVLGVEKAVLSVFYGSNKWESYDFQMDQIYASIVQDAVEKFWECVQTGKQPVAIESVAPIDAIRRVDMNGNNEWGSFAQQCKDNAAGKKLYDEALDGMRAMVGADVKEAYGYGFTFKRDARGALRMSGGK